MTIGKFLSIKNAGKTKINAIRLTFWEFFDPAYRPRNTNLSHENKKALSPFYHNNAFDRKWM